MLLTEDFENNLELCSYDSSDIQRSSYSEDEEMLLVFFKRGSCYSFYPVDRMLYEGFKNAESQSKFFNYHIKKNSDISGEKLSDFN